MIGPKGKAAVIFDNLLTSLVRIDVWEEVLPELLKLIDGTLDEWKGDTDIRPEDQLVIDVLVRVRLHVIQKQQEKSIPNPG